MSFGQKIAFYWSLLNAMLLLMACWEPVAAQDDCLIINSQHKQAPSNTPQYQSLFLAEKKDSELFTESDVLEDDGRDEPLQFRDLLSARSAIVIDGDSGAVLYAHDPDKAWQPASTIKILTGLISLRTLNKSEKVMISRKAAEMPRSKIYLQEGEQYTAGDLVYAVLLASANDASVALAEKIAGHERIFAKLMTYRAKKMGARKTVCKTATGLTAAGQTSTARDLVLIFEEAMNNPEFAWIMGVSKITTTEGLELENHNKALWNLHGAEGGKTGFTLAAKQTYVGKFCRGRDELIVALMGSEKMWDDLHYLVTYGFSQKKQTGYAVLSSLRASEEKALTYVGWQRFIRSEGALAAMDSL